MTKISKIKNTTPPTIPPTIGPIGVWEVGEIGVDGTVIEIVSM